MTAPDGPLRVVGLATWLASTAPARARGHVTVALVSDRRIRSLNRSFRGKDEATDVLSFPAGEVLGQTADRRTPIDLGDIVIAVGVARRQAGRLGHSLTSEVRILALHGLLHLLGYDHQTDSGQMAALEARLLSKAGRQTGLIGRQAR